MLLLKDKKKVTFVTPIQNKQVNCILFHRISFQ